MRQAYIKLQTIGTSHKYRARKKNRIRKKMVGFSPPPTSGNISESVS